MSDIDTAAADSLKVLDPKRPIREADIAHALIHRSLFTRFDTAIRTVQVLSTVVGLRLTELPAEGENLINQ